MRNSLLRGGLAVTVRQILSLPLNAAGITIASRLLSPEDYGVQSLLLPAIALAVALADLGTSPALVQTSISVSRATRTALHIMKTAGALVAAIVYWSVAPRVLALVGTSTSFAALLISCAAVGWLQSERSYLAVQFQRDVNWARLARIEVVEIAAYNVSLILSAWIAPSAWCFVVALAVRHLVGMVQLMPYRPTTHADCSEPVQSELGKLLRFGLPLQATALFGLLNGLVNPSLVGSALGAHAAGLVNWASSIVALPILPLQPLPAFLFSVLAARTRGGHDDRILLASAAHIGLFAVGLLSAVAALTIGWFVQFILGSQWTEAIPLVHVLSIGNTASIATVLLVARLTASGHSGHCLIANVFGTVILWGSARPAIGLFGIQGYGVAWNAASLAGILLLSRAAKRLTGASVKWTDHLLYGTAIVAAVVVHTKALGMHFVHQREFASIVLGVITFASIVVPWEIHRREDWRQFVGAIRRRRRPDCFDQK